MPNLKLERAQRNHPATLSQTAQISCASGFGRRALGFVLMDFLAPQFLCA
jgi:hypothetical protein